MWVHHAAEGSCGRGAECSAGLDPSGTPCARARPESKSKKEKKSTQRVMQDMTSRVGEQGRVKTGKEIASRDSERKAYHVGPCQRGLRLSMQSVKPAGK